jgi:transcriptional regulator with PAS, ATPase and Fis domain
MVIRSVLWIGSAEGLAASGLPRAPRCDVVWERNAGRVSELPLEGFDAVILDDRDPDPIRALIARRRPGLPVAAWPSELSGPDALADWLDKGSAAPDPEPPALRALVGDSAGLHRLRWLAARAARSRVNVLILGETGTGKELVARAIHAGSERRRARFVAVNCAAFPDTLLESELLGHVRGAFSGAERERRGLVEEASGGTLFLDEVAETSPAFQAKLLRVIQERVVRPLGANREREVDLRVIAATHRDLRRAVRAGTFREDLYYRLAVLPVAVPPLRERPGDLRVLAEHFLARHAPHGAPAPRIAPAVWPLLAAHRWPGNVRELENEILHAVALAEPGETLERRHFSDRLGGAFEPLESDGEHALPDEPLRDAVARLEALLIRRALAANGGRRAETARKLGLTREGLYKKMLRLGIDRSDERG